MFRDLARLGSHTMAAVAFAFAGMAWAQSPAPALAKPQAPPAPSAAAEAIYAAAKPRLLQIRTLLNAAGQRTVVGSGFLVGRGGVAMTNYHVVAQYLLDPATYRLEYASADGRKGAVEVLALDVAHDLALVRVKGIDDETSFFDFDERASHDALPKGERIFSMGNPLDLGFTIVEGSYSGFVERAYEPRIHFTGALNPGMSGGPTVAADGRVVGINVAKPWGGELVSFLVPARHALKLLSKAPQQALDLSQARQEIARQVGAWQAEWQGKLAQQTLESVAHGRYQVPSPSAKWFSCSASTNANAFPQPRALTNSVRCSNQMGIFLADDLFTGTLELSHTHAQSRSLHALQFASLMGRHFSPPGLTGYSRRHHTPYRCTDRFVKGTDQAPPMRVVICARAYRNLEGMFDFTMLALTQDSDSEALVLRFGAAGLTYESGQALAQRVLAGIKRSPAQAAPKGATP